ncbi:hypothetical protein CVFO_1023 [Isorropodon fossajaponicum endosymbiont JTNG4]|uniref:calcium-binding protein n=1 Tax=Isorropodon fossajaponicum symbiont TaxID=883811 RepID=UPI001916BE81|nr:calcium-binding protein [Isorropodon fossajaponicum symbiont]BBB24166.1 hypothetical protein CVFO_1023 [Isorropodon fossajaponicum endosymbiont JTNG4]
MQPVLEQAGDETGNQLLQALARDADLHLIGTNGNDILTSGSGFDILDGGSGHDTLDGDAGNDILNAGTDNDTYIFNLDDGQLEVMDANGYDVLKFGQGINMQDIGLYQDDTYIYLEILDTGDKVRFETNDNASQIAIDRIDFVDGTQWSQSVLMNAVVVNSVNDWQVL